MATEEEIDRAWWLITLQNTPGVALSAELERRGYDVVKREPPMPIDEIAGLYADQVRNEAPVQRWLQVWGELGRALSTPTAERLRIDALALAVEHLYLLLEPASVRELRRRERLENVAAAEFVEGDE